MRFTESPLSGAFVIDIERLSDDRGFFARTFCRREFETHGLNPAVSQRSVSFNPRLGTLRGMHYQAAPHGECKVVRCTRGAVFDVVVDLRHDSPTFRHWYSVELSAENHRMLYIPPGLAHGFQTLTPDAEVDYQMSDDHRPEAARGVRWDDPAFGIRWPMVPSAMSPRDRDYPDFHA